MKRLISTLIWAAAVSGAAVAEEAQLPAPGHTLLTINASDMAREAGGNIIARGKINISHPPVSITCVGTARINVSDGQFASLEAQGMAEASAGDKKLWGQRLYYEEARHLISVSGQPRAREGDTSYKAGRRIICYLETGVMKFDPHAEIYVEKSQGHKKKAQRRKFLGIF